MKEGLRRGLTKFMDNLKFSRKPRFWGARRRTNVKHLDQWDPLVRGKNSHGFWRRPVWGIQKLMNILRSTRQSNTEISLASKGRPSSVTASICMAESIVKMVCPSATGIPENRNAWRRI